jgi:hypothetical protein
VHVDLEGVTRADEILERFLMLFEDVIDRHDPKPVISRVEFGGETDLHDQIAADPEHLKHAVRSMAIAHFGDRAWIEKVNVRTRPKVRSVADPGPLRELSAVVADLMSNNSELLELGKALSTLFQKLPPDYRQGDARRQPDHPEHLRELVAQAHALLVNRMKKEAAAP